ncbi:MULTISPECIES: hypothetical protein [Streptomyces]|uniref:NIF system FeS cluster assembly NifU C-terminal domain-containing protein n=1 Tax=Streptomyces solicathayae TaxID=3081768 RepID=A0ABZ0LM54_9ACTN|nr:hypothetical protein [Streptomyces sp. HUAS YS2]WOX20375.1 hypothetical protein R2D22_02840 [Streptomyces sp. HUAS YS2]
MSATTAEQAGRRVEEVLDRLAENGDAEACAAAEEVVRVLMEFYGTGIARVVDLLGRPAARPPADPLGPLLADELVASLLNLHGLHPEDAPTRIDRALSTLPQPVENAGFEPATGVLRLRAGTSAGCGCSSTQESVLQAAVDALACFAPEVTDVELESAPREPALLQIGSRPLLAGADGRSSAAR